MVLNTICAVFWTAFGFGVMDWFIIVPNGLGAILGFVQMMLRLVVPSRGNLFATGDGVGGASSETTMKGDLELGVDTTTTTITATPSNNPSVVVDDSC